MQGKTKSVSPSVLPDPVICTVDIVLLTLEDGRLRSVLLPREAAPFQGIPALPGGFVHPDADRDLRDSAERVMRTKLGIEGAYLEQLGVFSGMGRDPRGWSLSVAWYTLVSREVLRALLPEHAVVRDASDLAGLPFDHAQIVTAAVERVQSKSSYSSLPVHLCPATFTLPQLQSAYEVVLGEPINNVSFRRKMKELDFLEPVLGAQTSSGAHRPAQLWRLRPAFHSRLSLTDRGFNSG